MAERHLVLDSIETPDGDRCVDIFRRDDGTFGFEAYRRDIEDPSGWFPIGRHRFSIFDSKAEARAAAKTQVSWLSENFLSPPLNETPVRRNCVVSGNAVPAGPRLRAYSRPPPDISSNAG